MAPKSNNNPRAVQGLSKVRQSASEQGEGFAGVGGEAAEGSGEVFRAVLSQEGKQRVAQRGVSLGRRTARDGAGVFTHADVADAMKSVLDGPVVAREVEQRGGIGTQARETRDETDRFDRDNAADRAFAPDAADLFCAGKFDQGRNARRCFDGARVDAPVAFINGLRRAKIGLSCLSFEGGAPRRRTRCQSRFEASSDCL